MILAFVSRNILNLKAKIFHFTVKTWNVSSERSSHKRERPVYVICLVKLSACHIKYKYKEPPNVAVDLATCKCAQFPLKHLPKSIRLVAHKQSDKKIPVSKTWYHSAAGGDNMYTLMKPVGAGALGAEFPLAGEHGPQPQHLPQPPASEGACQPLTNFLAFFW